MSINPKDTLKQDREDALRRHMETSIKPSAIIGHQPEGLMPRLAAWKAAAVESTKRRLRWLGPAIKPFCWMVPKLGHAFTWHWNVIGYRKDKAGQKHFSARRLAKCLLAEVAFLAISPFIAAGTYYHLTLKTYSDIFVPNAGVFVNQQFIQPNQSGHIVAPRDEIFTVLGQRVDEAGKVESVRFDVDSNLYFFYKTNALRPDLQAAKMVPISPYGAMCNVQATGLYTRLPRFVRINAVKWLDMRPEIVSVMGDCVQLQDVPTQYKQGRAPEGPPHSQHLAPPKAAPSPPLAPSPVPTLHGHAPQ